MSESTKEMSKPTCDNCIYFKIDKDSLSHKTWFGQMGVCRKNHLYQDRMFYDWCGEHKPKEEADNNE